jgi:hypothetical protein
MHGKSDIKRHSPIPERANVTQRLTSALIHSSSASAPPVPITTGQRNALFTKATQRKRSADGSNCASIAVS